MKKFLLAMGVAALGVMSASAATYTVFDINDPGTWTGGADGWSRAENADGFTIKTEKANSTTDLISPAANTYSWRIYKDSSFTITSSKVEMKTILITFDDYVFNGKGYAAEMTLGEGWTGTLSGVNYTLVNAGSKTFTATSAAMQVRIKKIEVSDEEGGITPPTTPVTDSFTVFDIANPGTWTGDANGWSRAEDANGFTITTAKGESTTDLISPAANQYSWRIYKGSSFTIESSKVDMKTIVITFDDYEFEGKGYVSELALSEGWTGTLDGVTYTLTSSGLKSFTATDNSIQVRIKKIEVSDKEGGIVPPVSPIAQYKKVNALESGSYVVLVGDQIGTPIKTGNYGRLNLAAATIEGDVVTTDVANAFDIEVADGKATIKNGGKFYAMDTEHLTSFQLYDEANEGSYWTYSFEGDNVKFVNALNTKCFVAQSAAEDGTFYTNIAPAEDPAKFNLPVLYKYVEGSGVEAIEFDENAPVEYFNIQGVRVANPENGLFIRVQGGKAVKVIL